MLAVKWDKLDFARGLLRGIKLEQISVLEEIVDECLFKEKVEFLQLIVSAGFQFTQYLTVAKLRELYMMAVSAGVNDKCQPTLKLHLS